jgi:quinol-cytochrome oxidoreductase complex cytochrome b subunit
MSTTEIERQWTTRLRKRAAGKLPPEKLLPDTQPAYVASWIYVFGVATLASLIVVIVTGCVLAIRGPLWWHQSFIGHFVNSLHLWSVEIFFFTMIIHLWGKFFISDQLRLPVDLDPGQGRH